MFEPTEQPRIFGLPPGAEFPAELVAGLCRRFDGEAPEVMARASVIVNTARMQRRIQSLFQQQGALLLPRLGLVTDLSAFLPGETAPVVAPLRRRLELAQLIKGLVARDSTVAPPAAIFDLAESLSMLMDEMKGEGVPPETVAALDVSDESGHWARSLDFIRLIQPFFAPGAEPSPRAMVERLIARWRVAPPTHPVIVAGSTGSRGATALLMAAVARLPQGAVVLPGFDFEMPSAVWDQLDDPLSCEDHSQFRFARLLRGLGLGPGDVPNWTDADPRKRRNRLVSLALRPAPVTDQWMVEGPGLGDLSEACADMALIEATSPRHEALAIALRLRQAAEQGRRAALITPDRNLGRMVTAALDRWALIPDDSAGRPLHLSAPGRFLRHVAALSGARLTAEPLLTLLKHPLCNTGAADRGAHLRETREFELWLRRKGPAFLTPDTVTTWALGQESDTSAAWADWLAPLLGGLEAVGAQPLADHVAQHLGLAERLSSGPGAVAGALWLQEAGIAALQQVEQLRAEAGIGGTMTPREYQALFLSVITGEVREPVRAHPDIMIWGTLEARVQGADLVILGGLNEGVWPEMPPPDPWLNRRMRQAAGLLLPERRVGLSAHDFQQAIAAREVVLSRATRDAEAETVVSRWLNRLTNLLGGLPGTGGPAALAGMRRRGRHWLDMADALDADFEPVSPENRPSPRPPVERRPTRLSVTRIKTLIRDPYAIYARHVLRLRPLDPLSRAPDAPLRGTILHAIFERFIRECPDPASPRAREQLIAIADEILLRDVPWPTARRIWTARLHRVVDWFLAGETARRANAEPVLAMLEGTGALEMADIGFTLTGNADRFDRRTDGALTIYDYKTGTPPSAAEMKHFDKQLLLEAAMAEAGAFSGLAAARVARVGYIGLGTKPVFIPLDLRDISAKEVLDPDETLAGLRRLLASYGRRSRGYTSRRAMQKVTFAGDYDHLARFGEWDESMLPTPEDVG